MRRLVVVFVIGCQATAYEPVELGTTHIAVTEVARQTPPARNMVRYRMRQALADLQGIEQALEGDRLDEVRAYAFGIATRERALEWSPSTERVTAAASELASATTLRRACRLAPAVGAACAACHARPPRPDVPAIPIPQCRSSQRAR